MDKDTEIEIMLLRVGNKSYGEIAKRLDLSVNTVKSFCLRHDLGNSRIKGPIPSRNTRLKPKREPRPVIGYCKDCGTAFEQPLIGGTKHFCSSLCRRRWNRKYGKGKYKQICPICGKEFPVIDDSKPRKYCSQDCYRTARYYLENPERETVCYCKTCGKKMILPGHKKRKFCSAECYHIYQRKVDNEVK